MKPKTELNADSDHPRGWREVYLYASLSRAQSQVRDMISRLVDLEEALETDIDFLNRTVKRMEDEAHDDAMWKLKEEYDQAMDSQREGK